MDIFPTQYSTLLASALHPLIEKKYQIKINALRLLIRNVSDTYIIEGDNKKYILKIYRKPYRTIGEIRAEVELLNVLKDNGANVSFPITDVEGNQIQQFNAAEGIRYGVLFSFALGAVVENLDNTQLSILGKEMALIHNVTSNKDLTLDRITYNDHTTIEKPLLLIQQRFSELPTEYSFLSNTAEKVKDKMSTYDLTKFNYGYCHFDFLPKNFHFDENNNITIFDFDWMGKGFLVNDHMTFFVNFFIHVLKGRMTNEEANEKFKIFIKAYRTVRAISDEEIEAIPYLGFNFWLFAFGFYEENYDDFSSIFLTKPWIADRVKLIERWTSLYCNFNV